MRVLIISYGTHGDIRPYVALGKALKERGHCVALCVNHRFEALVLQNGLEYRYMSDDIVCLIESVLGRSLLEGLNNALGFVRAVAKLTLEIGELQAGILKDTWLAAKEFQPDILLFSPKNYAAIHFAEKLGAEAIAAPLFPQFVPTNERPTLGFPSWFKSKKYNIWTYNVVRKISSFIGAKPLKEWREVNGLAPTFCGLDICNDTTGRPIEIINGYSAAVFPVENDQPNHVSTVGFWFLTPSPDEALPSDLVDFLSIGEKPIYIGFGSMASSRSKKVSEAVIQALQELNIRAVIATGWGGLEIRNTIDNIFVVEQVSHELLFPHVSAVVHHGGAGTTATGLKHACPTLVCPVMGDQPLWGERIYTLGLGPKPIQQNRITTASLTKSISSLLEDENYKKNAEAIASALLIDFGLNSACQIIESV